MKKTFEEMTVKELYKLAVEKNIVGRSKMNKGELIVALRTVLVKKSQFELAREFLKAKKEKAKTKNNNNSNLRLNLQFFASDYVVVDGEQISYDRIDNDTYGNPRYVVHFLALGIKLNDYGKIKGLTKYRGKKFGGMYVFYNIQDDIERAIQIVKDYYKG